MDELNLYIIKHILITIFIKVIKVTNMNLN